MRTDIIYEIGEAIILELDGVEEVTYPVVGKILILMKDGSKITLEVSE